MKLLTILVLGVVVFLCTDAQLDRGQNVEWGNIGPNDVLLSRETVVKKSKWLRVVSEDYVFPKKGTQNSKVITLIRVTDLHTKGTGGFASLLKGGPGFSSATIYLKSKRNHGYKFLIDIYGRAF